MARYQRTHRTFGQLDQLASGRWRARYTDAEGARRTAPVTFATRRDAEAYLDRLRAELLAGHPAVLAPCTTTLAQYAEAYLRTAAATLRPRTLDLYQRLTARWLLPAVGTSGARVELGALALSSLSVPLIRQWHAAVIADAHAQALAAATRRVQRAESRRHPARAWAEREGLEVPATGRLPRALLEAWERAGAPRSAAVAVPDSAGRTVAAQAYRLLHVMLAQAVTDGLLVANPCRVKGASTVEHPERLPLTPEAVAQLAEAVPTQYRAAVLVAAWSGLRPGEVFALRRCDVDTSAGTVSVHRTLVEVPGQPVTYGPPKSRAGRRTVALPRSVTAALAEHLDRSPDAEPEALLFTTRAGTPVLSGTRSRILAPARRQIGRPDVTWHHLRHTGATLAAIAGATQAELQARIGHSTARAAAIYQHARSERDRWIADQLETLTAPTPTPTPDPSPTPTPSPAPTPLAPHSTPAEAEQQPAETAPRRPQLRLIRSA